MIKKILTFGGLIVAGLVAYAQEDASRQLSVTGSVDTYYKYDLSEFKTDAGTSNIATSFANEQNSISLGMLDVILKKSVGKTSFTGDISFGPRGQYQSLPNGNVDAGSSSGFNIQNLYASYKFSDKLSMTAGYMATFVGYEVISPVGDFNYSTSYLFTSGPFQNAGIKADLRFSEKVGLMVGLFNDWNTYQDLNGISHVGVQLALAPIKGWTAYLNVLSGRSASGAASYGSGTVLDITTTARITDKFKLGLNAADYTLPNKNGGYSGVALYPQMAFSEMFSLGARTEYFKLKDVGTTAGSSVVSFTLSANVKAGPLTIIPEARLDSNDDAPFFNHDLSRTRSASQFLIAAVYAF